MKERKKERERKRMKSEHVVCDSKEKNITWQFLDCIQRDNVTREISDNIQKSFLTEKSQMKTKTKFLGLFFKPASILRQKMS